METEPRISIRTVVVLLSLGLALLLGLAGSVLVVDGTAVDGETVSVDIGEGVDAHGALTAGVFLGVTTALLISVVALVVARHGVERHDRDVQGRP